MQMATLIYATIAVIWADYALTKHYDLHPESSMRRVLFVLMVNLTLFPVAVGFAVYRPIKEALAGPNLLADSMTELIKLQIQKHDSKPADHIQ